MKTTAKKNKKRKFLVEYHNIGDATQESKPLREEVDYHNIRPLQPKEPLEMFRVNDEVDVFYNDGWRKGVITDMLEDSRYTVYFQSTKQSRGFTQSELRLHLKWIDGKWVNTPQKNQETAAVGQIEANVNTPNLTGISTCSIDTAPQLTPAATVNNFLENNLSSPRNMSGRMEYESTSNGTDSPFVPVFSSQKNMKQSTLKSDDEFSRPLKKAREEEEIISMSKKACSSRGTSIGMPIDEGTHSVLSFSIPKCKRSRSQNRRPLSQVLSELRSSPSLLRIKKENHEDSHVSEGQEKEDLEPNSVGRKLPLESRSRLHSKESEKFVTGLATPQETTLLGIEAAFDKTENVVKRKRGRPKGSCNKTTILKVGKQHHTANSKPQVWGMSFLWKGVENQNTTRKTINNVHTRTDTLEDCQTPFMFPGKADTSILEANRGIEHESSTTEPTIAQVDCAQMLSSSLKEDQALAQCPEEPFHTVNGIQDDVVIHAQIEKLCTELLGPSVEELQTPSLCHVNSSPMMGDEAGNNNPRIVQIECTQPSSRTLKEHQTLRLRCDKSSQQIVDKNEVNQLMPIEEITHTQSVGSPKHPQFLYEVGSSLNFTDVPAITFSSPLQPDEGLEKDSLPFIKVSLVWKRIEAQEVFQLIAQYPHFLPLKEENEELREGKAIGYMLTFANLMERIHKASLDDPRRMFEEKLKALDELEVFGFTVQPLRSKLQKMINIKDDFSQLHERSKKTKVEVTDEKHNADVIQESVTRLNSELQALLMQKEISAHKVTELKKTENEIEGRIHGARLDFDAVVEAPW